MRAAEGKRAAEGPKQAALRLYKPASALLLAGAGLQALGLVASALVSRRVLDEGGGEWLCALLLLAALLLFLRVGIDRLAGDAVDRAASDLRRATLDGLLQKDAAAYSRFHSGQLFSRLTKDIYTICEWRIRFLPQTAGQCIRLAAAAAAVLSLYAPLLGIVLAAGAAALLLSRPYHLRLKRLHLGVRRADETLTGCAQEILEHLELLQGMQAGAETARRFDDGRRPGGRSGRTCGICPPPGAPLFRRRCGSVTRRCCSGAARLSGPDGCPSGIWRRWRSCWACFRRL